MSNEVINICFVVGEERVNMGLVDEACALSLRQDEIGKKDQTKVGVEGKPIAGVEIVSRVCDSQGEHILSCEPVACKGGKGTHHETINQVHDSTREKQESTTQYISHGVS